MAIPQGPVRCTLRKLGCRSVTSLRTSKPGPITYPVNMRVDRNHVLPKGK